VMVGIRPSSSRHRGLRVLAPLVLFYGLVGGVFVFNGRAIIDEGIYINAARLVAQGDLPYRDFPFSQGPMLPFAYLGGVRVFDSWLIGGRMISWAAGLAGVAAAVWLARRLAGALASLLTLTLLLSTLPALWVGMTVRAQAVGMPLLMLGAAAMALPRTNALSWSVAPSLMLWSSGMRLTNIAAFAGVALWVAWQLRSSPRILIRVAGILGAQSMIVLAPILVAPRDSLFHILTAQLTRSERIAEPSQSFIDGIIFKANLYLEFATSGWLLLLLATAALAGLVWNCCKGWRPNLEEPMGDARSAQFTLFALALLAFMPHLFLSGAYLTYLIPIWTLFPPAVAIAIASWCRGLSRSSGIGTGIAISILAIAGMNAGLHWNIWIGTGDASLKSFRQVAYQLRALGGPNCTMLTFQSDLAVEADCALLPGLEYSYFSFFPDATTQEAETLGVINRELLYQRVAEILPELIVLSPGELPILVENSRQGMEKLSRMFARDERRGDGITLDILGPIGSRYRLSERIKISSGIRPPVGSEIIDLLVFALEEAETSAEIEAES